jgi:hypothetical protein
LWPDSHRLEVRAVGPHRACHPWNASASSYRVVRPPPLNAHGPSPDPCCACPPRLVAVLRSYAGLLLRRAAEEPTGYKGRPRCRAQAARHGTSLAPPRQARPLALFRNRVAPLPPSLGSPRASSAAYWPGLTAASPEASSQRPPEAGAAEPPRWHALGAVQPPESVVGETLSTPPPFPG